MGMFSKSKKKDKLMLVFHIGSGAVEAAFFLAQDSQDSEDSQNLETPKIIFSAREQIKIEPALDINTFLPATLRALDAVVARAYEARLGAPARIFCVLSSPLYVSETRTISLKKNTPFLFTEKLADLLIQKEIKLFQEEYAKKYTELGVAVREIELKNIKTLLNGYETPEPLGQSATQAEMVIFVSMSGKEIVTQIEQSIAKYFFASRIKFSSFAMASFAAVRDILPEEQSFLLIDVDGEVTDISMIKKNVLSESISFPLGRNFFTRGAASSLGSTLTEADSLISLFIAGHADEKVAAKLLPVMERLQKEWLKNFQESLADLSHDISIPAILYLSVDKSAANFFRETIMTEQFNQYTLTESKFRITFLEPPLVLDSVYINRFLATI